MMVVKFPDALSWQRVRYFSATCSKSLALQSVKQSLVTDGIIQAIGAQHDAVKGLKARAMMIAE